jgi:hypothetical protein
MPSHYTPWSVSFKLEPFPTAVVGEEAEGIRRDACDHERHAYLCMPAKHIRKLALIVALRA